MKVPKSAQYPVLEFEYSPHGRPPSLSQTQLCAFLVKTSTDFHQPLNDDLLIKVNHIIYYISLGEHLQESTLE